MRTLKYVGTVDRVDCRGIVGSDDEKFVFYPVGSKVDPVKGAKQAREGVAMTNDQAAQILTHRHIPTGFADITAGDAPTLDGAPVAANVVATGVALDLPASPLIGNFLVADAAPAGADKADARAGAKADKAK